MKDYLIKAARCTVGNEGLACAPMGGDIVTEVLTFDGVKEIYFTLVEVSGIPILYRTDSSIFEIAANDDISQEDIDSLEEYLLPFYDYDDFFDNKDDENYELYRYMLLLTRSRIDESKKIISNTVGKRLSELKIPMSDIEEDYLKKI